MKIKNLLTMQILGSVILITILMSCEDPGSAVVTPTETEQFSIDAMSDPVIIDGVTLGGSWRLVRDQGSYEDGDFRKEYDIDLIEDIELENYKEYWTFDHKKVMILTEGALYDKNWDGYYEIFDMGVDLEEKLVTIDYVYDDDEKTYTRTYAVTLLTETELVLTIGSIDEESFFQHSFRR